MLKLNTKTNLRQFLTDKLKPKIKIQHSNKKSIEINKSNINQTTDNYQTENTYQNINTNPNYNFVKPLKKLSSSNNLNLLISALKNKNDKKISTNNNLTPNSNLFSVCNNFRKSKTTEKNSTNNIGLLIDYKENQASNSSKKIMIKQNTSNINSDSKPFTINVAKVPKYDISSFKQVLKYYTIKSESKTIQLEELSSYLRPIRNILGNTNNKTKTQNNIYNNKNNFIIKEKDKEKTTINNDLNEDKIDNIYDITENNKSNNPAIKNYIFPDNEKMNNKLSYTQRTDNILQIPFNIKIDKINGEDKNSVNIKENTIDKNIKNNENKTNNAELDTMVSTTTNVNVVTDTNKENQISYQFRTRRINIPKTGVNLSSMNLKNQILQNILNKRNKRLNSNK